MDNTTKCTKWHLCHQWRTCRRCGKIRQAKFADKAQDAARQMILPTLYVLVPDDTSPDGIEYARRFFQRQTRPTAGVWTIESGEFRPGYHLNVISEWSEIEGRFKGHIYREPIRTGVRNCAAYISKAIRSVGKEEGFARALGHFGNIADWLRSTTYDAPIVAGAQHQHDINPNYLPASPTGEETPYETAKRHLALIMTKRTI
jgi:hypothetical protein